MREGLRTDCLHADVPMDSFTGQKPAARPRTRSHSCSVCLEVFTDPKVLPCCHTFCLNCLEKTARSAQTRGEITCPQCRNTHPIPAGGLNEFLTDFMEVYEIEAAGLKSESAGSVVCGECEESSGPPRSYCTNCRNYLCNECVQLHKRVKAYLGHEITSTQEISTATVQSHVTHYCTIHKQEALKLYCVTCMRLICRDCTLVEHRQHDYKFVENARKQVEDELGSLKSDAKKNLTVFSHNLKEIRKVEEAVVGHTQVLKADINYFFDKLVQSIEAKRKGLLEKAGGTCQTDLKQVWADKEFHETAIAHIQSVLRFTEKAHKCTSDSEMILTALHSISQLRVLQAKEWESFKFTDVVRSTPQFKQSGCSVVNEIGSLDRNELPHYDIQILHVQHLTDQYRGGHNVFASTTVASGGFGYSAGFGCSALGSGGLKLGGLFGQQGSHNDLANYSLGSQLSITVNVGSPPVTPLVDGRSGAAVSLSECKSPELKAVVHYGHSAKELDRTSLTIAPQRKQTESPAGLYGVNVRLICSGQHTLTLKVGSSEEKRTFSVVGQPQNGRKVRRGPDWQHGSVGSGQIGTVHFQPSSNLRFQCQRGGFVHTSDLMMDTTVHDMVTVTWGDSATTTQHKWGRDGKYEIELTDCQYQQNNM